VFFPAAPLFLLIKGKDITIPKGTEIAAFVAGDVPLDAARFSGQTGMSLATTAATGAVDAEVTSVMIKSTPDGAEITVDGKLVGSTPSTIKLKSGDHAISVTKPGFKSWERTVTLNPASTITLDVSLEKSS
jgi:PEGA domain